MATDNKTVTIDKEDLNFILDILNRVSNGESVSEADKANLDAMREKDLNARIRAILLGLGVRQGIKGYEYLKTAIKMCMEDRTALDAITKVLYPGIAEIHNTTGSRVERAIRHAIEVAFDNPGGDDVKEAIFGNSTDWNRGKPTNNHFVSAIVEYLQDT